jgi:hypothetical protein
MWNTEMQTGIGYFVVSTKDEALDLLMFTLQGEITFLGHSSGFRFIRNVLMYILCILFSLLCRPTNAQTYTYIYIYIYINNNILYIVSTPTCFNASSSSSGSINLVLAKVTEFLKLQLNKHCNILMYCICGVVILIIL